jgi:hypothetical protein
METTPHAVAHATTLRRGMSKLMSIDDSYEGQLKQVFYLTWNGWLIYLPHHPINRVNR